MTWKNTVVHSDVMKYLETIPDGSLHCVITSPPYFNLRSYGEEGQVGHEATPDEYVERLVTIFRGVRRVLSDTGTCWINLGDTFANDNKWGGSTGGLHQDGLHGDNRMRDRRQTGVQNKSLIGIPWRVALALQADGWILRCAAPWIKRNAFPESVKDRPTIATEYIFLFVKSASYWYDREAIALPLKESSIKRVEQATLESQQGGEKDYKHDTNPNRSTRTTLENFARDPHARNRRDTDWFFESVEVLMENGGVYLDGDGFPLAFDIPTAGSKIKHYAMFPSRLVEPMIRGGCPPVVCVDCGRPYRRHVTYRSQYAARQGRDQMEGQPPQVDSSGWEPPEVVDEGLQPDCTCGGAVEPGVVCDPFMGAGTTALVAQRLGYHYTGCDLNGAYVELALRRLHYHGDDKKMLEEQAAGVQQQGLFS